VVRIDPGAAAAALRVLGLDPGATTGEITGAYRRLARSTHPDRCTDPGAGDRFVEVGAAYRLAISAAGRRQDQVPRNTGRPSAVTPTVPPARGPAPDLVTRPVRFAAGPVRVVPWPAGTEEKARGRHGD
jgi:hypothetical protein